MRAEEIEAVQDCLRTLAANDLDRARDRNGVGFSGFDSDIGHSLARVRCLSQKQAALGRRICRKYWRQLGTEMVEAMG